MPAAPGETVLTTLFADVHYFFSDPTAKPQHHRFDRTSYVYIYHNVNLHQAKLEIANHAGTPDQDAFSGLLNATIASYSYLQPTRCSLRVDAHTQDQTQWHLPAYDERNETKYLYKLHTVDIYLWTEKDAATFLGHLKAVMPASRLEIKDAPSAAPKPAGLSPSPAEHRDSMSPVVQQLEKTAVGAQFSPRAESAVSAHSLPGPPTPATGISSPMASPPQQPAPMAYNPAAPPAPEPIAHREKTPPPPDDGRGTGLTAAAKYDAIPHYASIPPGYQQNSNQPTPQQAYFSGPPQPQQQHPFMPTFAGPPQGASPGNPQRSYSSNLPPPPPPGGSNGPSPSHQHQQQFGPPPTFPPQTLDQNAHPTSPPQHQQSFTRQPSFGPNAAPSTTTPQQFASYPQQMQTQQYANYPQSPGFTSMQQPPTPSAPPAYAGHTPISSPGLPPPPPSSGQPHQQHAYGGYDYTAAQQTPSTNVYGAYTGDVHSQVYRPTSGEAAHGHGHGGGGHGGGSRPAKAERTASSGRLEERVDRAEKKVGMFLKRLDKLI